MKSLPNHFFNLLRAVFGLLLVLGSVVLLQPAQGAVAAPPERLLAAQPPSVTLNVPATAFLGANVPFTVTFDNPDPADPGYGPIIDLEIPTNGVDGPPNPDGLSFVSATYLGSAVPHTAITVPAGGCITHPYMMDGGTQAPLQVCGLTPGNTFVALRLPFGSFTADQPPLTVNVTASMSNLADLGVPLTIRARGGYQYGYTPLNDFCCGDNPAVTLSPWANASVTPILFTLEKTYNGPEDETATGPNFPRRYTVTAEIAPGQTLSPFTLTDILPGNIQFVSLTNTTPGGATCTHTGPANPGGTLACDFASASGTVSMTFEYYIPLRDAGGDSVIDPATGDDATSCNNASGGGSWTPIDTRDTGGVFTQDPAGCEHTLTPKSIATQKHVQVVGGGQPAPGQVLEYTIDIQISDFFAFDQIVLTDTISDGQRWDATFTPTLQIVGNPATLNSAGAFGAANYTVDTSQIGNSGPGPDGTDGSTTITFRVSDEMILRAGDGRMVGGCVPPTGAPGDPSCALYNDSATTAQVIFRTVIQEDFSDTYPSGDSSVDQGDVLNNIVGVAGRVLSTVDAVTPTGSTEEDGSAASVAIGRGSLSKSVYAFNGVTPPPSPVRVAAGDTVTFRLTYTLTTSDFENLMLTDYLPLPIFTATEVTGHNNTMCGVPGAGTSCLGPADTYHFRPAAVDPAVSSNGGSNWVRWNYGSYDSAHNTASTIDILFTVTVGNSPFADNLHLTNQAYVTEGSTNGDPGESASIIEITYTSPVMTTTKSVVATDNPAPTFTPTLPITFTAPGSGGPRWPGTINSSLLTATPIDSDVSGLDAGDLVTFAIFLVNEGSGIKGAFDIVIRDFFDANGFEYPTAGDANSINLQIYYGNGSGPIPYTRPDESTAAPGDLFGPGLKLVDPPGGNGVCQAHDPASGNNVIVITYDLRVRNGVAPGTYPNTAVLTNYSGSEGGPNFLPDDQEDDATVTTDNPQISKTLVGTELNNANNSATQAVIGEFATYTVTLTIPEGLTPNATLVDTLDAGLAFVSLDSVTLSPGLSITGSAAPVISSSGGVVTFNFGDITNTDRDNTVDETITLTYRVVVLNVISNQAGVALNNAAALTWTGGSAPTVYAPNVTVIEPVINTTKAVAPAAADAGDNVTFTVTLANPPGSTTAYDVTWSDTLPAGLTYVPGSLALGACSASTPLALVDTGAPTLTGNGGLFQPGQSCAITFHATVNYSAMPGQTITNTAQTRWTSLPGDVSDRSTHNNDSDERTGADGVGGALNDYASQGQAAVTIASVAPVKSLAATSELHTGLFGGTQRVAVGEIVRYRLVVRLPEGTSPNFQIRDNLPTGLTYLDDGTARLALLSNGNPIASTEPTGSSLGLALGAGAFGSGPWVNGNDPAAVTPTFPLPDANVGSSAAVIADPDVYGTGADPYFKLGNLTNNDSDADAEYVIVEFNALVDNTAAGSNDASDTRNNTFGVSIGGVQNGSNSNSVQVVIVEPSLALVKNLTTAPVDAGDPITYTLIITSAAGNNRSTAFDLSLTDALDVNLTGLTVSSVISTQGATCVGNGAGTTAFTHNSVFAGNALTFTASCLDPGQTITLTITGTVAATAPTGYVIPNTANLVYTSLPGVGTTPNPTGSTTPGGSGADNGERDGSDGVGGAVDDYAATSSINAPLAAPQIEKLAPTPAQYVIGEQVTFNIRVTLPEGVTQALQVVDDLPLGLAYVSHQVITTAAASGGLLTADYNGTLLAPTVTAPGGSGDDLTLVFGDTTTAADNITTNNAFLVQVVARVLNVAGNQNGTALINTATVSWTGGSGSDSTTITVLEPELDIQKAADDSAWVYGQTVNFTLTVSHLAASAADAHDVVITDTIPAGLTYVTGSITASAGCTANASGAPALVWTCAVLPRGNTATLTYQVTVNSPPTPPFLAGDDTALNTAHLAWTSQPGDNNPGADDGERDGSGGVNDYFDDGAHTGRLEEYYGLGNRVWFDTNNNGVQDAGEVGVDGVTVNLYAADGAGNPSGPVVATTFTAAGGYYLFDYLLPGDYVVVIPYGNFSVGVLNGYKSSLSFMNANGTIGETPAPGPNNDTDRDDNGSYTGLLGFEGAVISGAVTLGPSGNTEPLTETDLQPGVGQGDQPNGRANMTVDFGFYRTEIGNLVYRDENVDGAYDAGDTLLQNVQVRLYAADGVTEINVGPNGILGDGDDAPGGVLTDAGGVYRFGGLPEGDYIVRVTTPAGHVSTVDTANPADTTNPNGNVDNNDNGIGIGAATAVSVQSNAVTMDAGNPQTNNVVTNGNGTTYNPTLDFGFTYAYALGNRVWFDTDNDSLIDIGTEVGVNGVVVDLYRADAGGNPAGPVLATDTTANGGYYLFDSLTAGDYVVVLPASNFAAGGVLNGYWSSATTMQANGAITEAAAPDPDGAPDVDSDDNGQLNLYATLPGAVASRAVTLGPGVASEPTGESDLESGVGQGTQPDDRANMTVDFGFYRVSVGNLVYTDLNKNGAFGGADTPIANAVVRLYAEDGVTELPVGADGILGTADDGPGGMFTDVAGLYLFSGLPAGNYIVSVEAPANASSTIDNNPLNDNNNPNWNVDNNDNGVGTGDGEVFSNVVTLTPGGGTRPDASAKPNVGVDAGSGTTTDLTVDFGFVTAYALGNRVWFDTDNSSQINGTEVGADGVQVELYYDDGAGNPGLPVMELDGITPRVAVTTNGGYYLFDYLNAGDYVVVIPAANFAPGAALEGYWSSGTSRNNAGALNELAAPDPDNDVDSDDNGSLRASGAVVSLPVTLGGAALEPAGEADLQPGVGQGAQPDNRANMTVDFGFYRTEIGNLVYRDENVDGAYDAGDTLLAGVTVELLSGDGLTVLATTTTDGGGAYRFGGLPEGDYIVRVTTPAGHVSTVDTANPADTTNPNGNVDNNDNGIGIGAATAVSVQSNAVTMDAGNPQTNNVVTNGNGTTYNPTLDFGFTYAYALGNRVWFDTDNDSLIDIGTEVGVNGVVVDLYRADAGGNPAGPVLATDTTANGGYYLFDSLTAGDYVVVLPASNFVTGGVLNGYWSSGTTMQANGAITEAAAPDPDGAPDVDSDDNGQLNLYATLPGAVASRAVTLGPGVASEPTGESDLEGGVGQGTQPDGRANMTVDFGFYRVSVGNLVYTDGNENGNYDGGPLDVPLPNIPVRLYAQDGVTEIPVGPDGILGTADDGLGGVVTDAGGNYRFSNLPQGNYVVTVTGPASTSSSRDDYNAADSANPNTNADDNDNGLGTGTGNVSSAVFALTPGSTGALNNNTVTHADGSTYNPTIDFGFVPQYALGNRVWFDTNNDRQINAGEMGIDGVTVELYAANASGNPTGAALGTATTVNGGYYLFNNLASGDYVVVLPAVNFTGVLNAYWSSGTTRNDDGTLTEIAAPGPNNDVDSDDNGQLNLYASLPGAVASRVVTLGFGPVEPTGEADTDGGNQGQPDAWANMTVDFGFYTIELGNQVWVDANNNGLLDGAEIGIDGVTVQLWSADNSTLIATTTTAGGGVYTFAGLPQGNYHVRLSEGNFQGAGVLRDYYSSTGGAGNPYEPAPNPDADLTDSDDNGSEVGSLGLPGGYIQSGVFALTPQAEQTFNHGLGLTTEFRVDFGVFSEQRANLSVTKDDGVDYYLQGGTLTYTIVVSNSGPADVVGAVVADAIPTQVLSWDWVCAGATGGATGCDGVVGSTADFTDTVDLPIGSSITYTVTANIQLTATDTLTNTVTVTPPAGVIETDLSDNSATDTDRDAILSIDKDDGLITVAPGSLITYILNVQNAGALDLTHVLVTDDLPAEVTFQSAVPAPTTAPSPGTPGGTLTWTGITLNAGDSTSIAVTVRVNDNAIGPTIVNNVSVEDTTIPGLNDSDDDIDIVATSNLKTIVGTDIDPSDPASPTPPPLPNALIGEVITYQISLDVPAGATLTNLNALDILDPGLAFASCVNIDGGTLVTTLPGGFADACNDPTNPVIQAEPVGSSSPINQGRRATFTLGDVTNPSPTDGETLLITYNVVVLDSLENVDGVSGLNNSVLWTWDGGSLVASAPPLEVIEADMNITKDAMPTIAPIGSTITFTLSIEHTPESSIDAYDVLVTDFLPAGLGYVDGSAISAGLAPTSITYNPVTHGLSILWDVFPLGQTATITFRAVFLGPTPVTNSTNLIWTSLPIDPQPNGEPQPLSDYNDLAHERWYDPADSAGIDNYGVSSSITINAPRALPATGFAPDRVTPLPEQPASKAYADLGDMWLEIPNIGVKIPLTGVPLEGDGWDLTWLSNQAGYLSGTTFPGQIGTTGLTAHVTLADGTPGPFRNLDQLYWGNTVILHADGYRYTYEVREMRTVLPSDFSVFKQDGYTWLTLVTCKGYVPWLNTYNYRYAVRAVLLQVEYEGKSPALPRGLSR